MMTTESQASLLKYCLMYFLKYNDDTMSKQNRALLFVDMWNRIRPQRIVSRYTFKGVVVTVTKAVTGKYSAVFQIRNMSCISNRIFDSLEEAECHAEISISVCI